MLMKSHHAVDIIKSTEYWSQPPKLSLGFGPLPVLQTFRAVLPAWRIIKITEERVIVPGPGVGAAKRGRRLGSEIDDSQFIRGHVVRGRRCGTSDIQSAVHSQFDVGSVLL